VRGGGGGGIGIGGGSVIPEGRERNVTWLGWVCACGDYRRKGVDQVHEDEPRDEREADICVWVIQGVVILIVRVRVIVVIVPVRAFVVGGDGVQRLNALGNDHDEGCTDEDAHAEGRD